jgi:hypothetical protein
MDLTDTVNADELTDTGMDCVDTCPGVMTVNSTPEQEPELELPSLPLLN